MSETKDKIKVLFLCTGNSCRSQIAEGWAKHLKPDVIEAYSAGIYPVGVNPRTIKVMAEAGVDISSHTSKHIDTLRDVTFNYVVTLCDNAREQCPIFPRPTEYMHRLFADPSFMSGSEDEILAAFRTLRDDIKAFVETMPESLEKPA